MPEDSRPTETPSDAEWTTTHERTPTTAAGTPTVAACQMTVADLDVAANLATIEERVAGLPPEVDIAVFPEYALTGFVADERAREVALARDGETLDRLRETAAGTDTALLVGFVERAGEASDADAGEASDADAGEASDADAGEASDADAGAASDADAGATYYNATAYLDPHGGDDAGGGKSHPVETTVYRKRHLWGNESEVLTPGDQRVTVKTPVGTAALLTCYDLNSVGESAAFATPDVDALFVVGAWPAAHSQNWKLLLRARALDGVRWVVGAGRTGQSTVGDPTEYAGRSRVVRPDGSVQAGLNRGERDLVAALDPAVLAECREFIPVLEE